MAGYSPTPLWRKLGFKTGYRVRVSNAPGNYAELVTGHPQAVLISGNIRKGIDI